MEPQLDPDDAPEAFFDAPDCLPPPEPDEPPVSSTTTSDLHLAEEDAASQLIAPAAQPPQTPPSAILRRRRTLYRSATSRRNLNTTDWSPSERRNKALLAAKDQVSGVTLDDGSREKNVATKDQVSAGDDEGSGISGAQGESSGRGAVLSADSTGGSGPPPPGLLVSIAGFIIKAIGLQISLLVAFVTFPFWLLYCSLLLVRDPFGTVKRGRDHVWRKLTMVCTVLWDRVAPVVFEKLSSQRGFGKWVLRLALGCFWSFYVCLALLGCLVSAFLIGRLLIGSVVEEPLQFTEELSFDYTKASPVAVVPVVSCQYLECGLDCSKNVRIGKGERQRLVPPNHKLQATVSLTLPESDYNRNLGVFQVKVEFLSAQGRIMYSSSRPCMLQFKSSPVRFMETFFRSGSLLTGYSSESQTLNLKVRGFTEGSEPTACIRIILDRRAEYRPGAGVPELYVAHIRLESELPLLKKFIWNWKRTLFIWISMWLFISELLFILVCCAPLIIPRPRQSNVSLEQHSN